MTTGRTTNDGRTTDGTTLATDGPATNAIIEDSDDNPSNLAFTRMSINI